MSAGFRFSVNLLTPDTRSGWAGKARRAEQLGYDVVAVPDHLGMPAPFPSLMHAAAATERITLGTFVLNTPFYNSALLARDAAAVDQFSGGRLELGLGAGYVKEEFEAAGMPFPSARSRVDHLEETIRTLRTLYAGPGYQPVPAQAGGPPLLIAGSGNRLLRIAAQYADVVALPGAGAAGSGLPTAVGPDVLADRVSYVRGLLGARDSAVELNLLIWAVAGPHEHGTVGERMREALPGFTDDQIDTAPSVLVGTPRDIADRLRAHWERYGISYFTVLEADLDRFAPVIELLK